MQTISATEAKNHLATAMDAALKEPVMIEKNGQPYVVMMSAKDYVPQQRKQDIEEFLKLCHDMAQEAQAKGMTDEILQSILNDDD